MDSVAHRISIKGKSLFVAYYGHYAVTSGVYLTSVRSLIFLNKHQKDVVHLVTFGALNHVNSKLFCILRKNDTNTITVYVP